MKYILLFSCLFFASCLKQESETDKSIYHKSSAITSGESRIAFPESPQNKMENDCQNGFYRDPETDTCVEDLDPQDIGIKY